MIVDEIPITRRSGQSPPPDHIGGRLRLLLVGFGMLVSFSAIILRLYNLQVLQSATFRGQQENVSVVTKTLPALRGLIYDRNDVPLVLNAPAYQVSIIPNDLPFYADNAKLQQREERAAIYNRLAEMLAESPKYASEDQLNVAPVLTDSDRATITAGEIFTRVSQAIGHGLIYAPVLLAENVPRDLALIIQEQAINMPGVVVSTVGSRVYPYHELLGNVLGYISKIPAEREKQYREKGYDPDLDRVGVSGIEFAVEDQVRGTNGSERLLRDAAGEVQRRIGETRDPVDGFSVRLSIDMRLQQIMSDTLFSVMRQVKSPRAAAVAINPNTGEVLGMVGFPSYDNNVFIRGVTQRELDAFTTNVHRPLLNKATSDQLPPGSIFKIVTASALLEEGVIDANTRVNDPGIFSLPNENDPTNEKAAQKFYCWKRTGHGSQNVRDALRNSCDTFFYKTVGGFLADGFAPRNPAPGQREALGPEKLAKWMQEFGIGEDSNIEIEASAGFRPSDQFKRKYFGERWTTGDSYNMAIGQGFVLVTPLEMANMMATIANGGTRYQPQLVRDVIDAKGNVVTPFQPKVARKLPISTEHMALIQGALKEVVGPTGTANTSIIPGFAYAGKTGTAEFCDDIAQKLGICYPGIKIQPSHAWFVSYAPADKPQIAMAVYVWNGCQGSGVAAPITQRILAQYFNVPLAEKDKAKVIAECGSGVE